MFLHEIPVFYNHVSIQFSALYVSQKTLPTRQGLQRVSCSELNNLPLCGCFPCCKNEDNTHLIENELGSDNTYRQALENAVHTSSMFSVIGYSSLVDHQNSVWNMEPAPDVRSAAHVQIVYTCCLHLCSMRRKYVGLK